MNNKFYHSVFLKSEDCVGCFTCLKRCPTSAIRIRNRKAFIISEFCIDCGECIRHCKHHAKRSHRDALEYVLGNYKYTVALPAPALYSQFNNISDVNIILTAIKLSGFDDVFEVSTGAELVSEATRSYIKEHPEKWPIISTACPTIERLIRVRFPNLIDHLLPLLPPMEVAGKLARQKAVKDTGLAPEDIGIVFISPCPSKIAFLYAPLGLEQSNVDHAIAIKDYYPVLLTYLKEAEKHPEVLSQSGRLGKGWATSGGEAMGVQHHEYLAADGIENVIKVLEDLEDEKFLHGLQFVELNSCNAGCVGGALTVENSYLAKAKTEYVSRHEPGTRTSFDLLENFEENDIYWSKPIEYEPVYSLGENIFDSMQNMGRIDELQSLLPGLDCGCCGAPNCKYLASDIVMRQEDGASLEDCIFLSGRKNEN